MTRTGPFADFGESLRNAVLSRAGRLSSRVHERRGLEADLLESEDTYRIVFDAPGATSSDVQVRYLEGSVLVRLDRYRTFHEGYEMRFPGRGLSLDGRVELPDNAAVDPETATATLTDRGTLEIDLPKVERPGELMTAEPAPEEDAGGETFEGESGSDGPSGESGDGGSGDQSGNGGSHADETDTAVGRETGEEEVEENGDEAETDDRKGDNGIGTDGKPGDEGDSEHDAEGNESGTGGSDGTDSDEE